MADMLWEEHLSPKAQVWWHLAEEAATPSGHEASVAEVEKMQEKTVFERQEEVETMAVAVPSLAEDHAAAQGEIVVLRIAGNFQQEGNWMIGEEEVEARMGH